LELLKDSLIALHGVSMLAVGVQYPLATKTIRVRKLGSVAILKCRTNTSYLDKTIIQRLHNQIGKACALAAATLILPVLAQAQIVTISTPAPTTSTTTTYVRRVPEGGPGTVLLITTFGAILLLSARLSSRKKAQPDPK
jgi:hypothetical protein